MFAPSDFGFLNIDRVGRFSIFSPVSFDINREANAGIDIVIFTGSKVIDIIFSTATVLDGIRNDFYSWIFTWNHTTGSVDYGPRKRQSA